MTNSEARKRKEEAEAEVRALVVGDPDACNGVRSNGGGEDSYNEVGDPCSSCGNELLWDRDDRMTYCVNDWYHG
jgi:hypothetical protein